MRVIIDRFEEEFAVVELSEGKFYDLPRALFVRLLFRARKGKNHSPALVPISAGLFI